MKVVLIILVLAAAGWFFYDRSSHQAPAAAAAPAPNVVERYGQSLADDVKRADVVRDKANAAIKQAEDARKTFSQTEPQ